jgi:hypothetical protein
MMLASQNFFLEFQYFLLGRSLSDGAQYKTSQVHLKFGMSKMVCELLKILTLSQNGVANMSNIRCTSGGCNCIES